MILIISSIGKGEPKVTRNAQVAMVHDGIKQQERERGDEQLREIQSVKQVARQMAALTNSMTPVLRYVPKFRHKERESPFSGVINGEAEGKITRNVNDASLGALKGSVTLPTQKVYQLWVSRHPLHGFVSSSEALLKEENDLPHAWTKEGFDLNTYELMDRAGYDFQNPATLGKVIEVKAHGLNETQKVIHEQGGSVGVSKVGLGYTPL